MFVIAITFVSLRSVKHTPTLTHTEEFRRTESHILSSSDLLSHSSRLSTKSRCRFIHTRSIDLSLFTYSYAMHFFVRFVFCSPLMCFFLMFVMDCRLVLFVRVLIYSTMAAPTAAPQQLVSAQVVCIVF
jgi:hypothetical protein